MSRRLPPREHGLSLVELLLGLAITALVLAPLVPMLGTASAAARIGGDQVAIEREADFALQRIAARIRASSTPVDLIGTTCDPLSQKPALYEVTDLGLLREKLSPGKYLDLADSVTCITLGTLSSSSERPLVRVSLDLKRDTARASAIAIVPLGVAP